MRITLAIFFLVCGLFSQLKGQNSFDVEIQKNIALITNVSTSDTLKIVIDPVIKASAVVVIIFEREGNRINKTKNVYDSIFTLNIDASKIELVKIKHVGQFGIRLKRKIYLEGKEKSHDDQKFLKKTRTSIRTNSSGDTTTTTTISSV